MRLKNLIIVAGATVVLSSCSSGPETREMKDYVSAFVNEDEAVVSFGNMEVKSILKKTGYEKVDMFKAVLDEELNRIDKVMNVDESIFYAMEGPFDNDGAPAVTYLFIKVKDENGLKADLTKRGYDVNQDKDLYYTEDGDFALGFRKDLAIAMIKGGDYDAKKDLKAAFDKTQEDMDEKHVTDILSQKGDLVVGMDIEALYSTSSTDLSKLNEEKQKEIKESVAESYVQTVFKFENGAAIVETKNLFSDKLKEMMFFKEDANASILKNLGTGEPRAGFAVNLDVNKLQQFLDNYSPQTMKELGELTGGGMTYMMMASGSKGLSNLINGKMGAVAYFDGASREPYLNVYLGFGPNGEGLGMMAKEFLAKGDATVEIDKNGLSFYSKAENAPIAGQKLNLPQGCENFGKSGIFAFLNLDGIDPQVLDELEDGQKLLKVVKYATFEYNADGGRLYIKAKNGQENVLKQSLDVVLEDLMMQMGGMEI